MDSYKTKSFKDLIVWKKSMELAKLIYAVTLKFPQTEQYGLVSQMRRAAVSIPSNIAEGYGRSSKKEYAQFYSISYGSLLELETQIILSTELGFINNQDFIGINNLREEVSKMLYVMISKLRA